MKLLAFFLALSHFTVLAHAQSISYVPHNSITPIHSKLGGVYNAYQWYQPSISVKNGCVPFPAVGHYTASSGLRLGGARNGNCGGSPGQVYARHKNYPNTGVRGIMYAYYFPKDQFSAGSSLIGHRHDWEEVIVWVPWDWTRPLGASMSGHGSYTTSTRSWNGSHKQVLYANIFRNHAFSSTSLYKGSYGHPIANWYQLTREVRYTLNNAVWFDQKGKQRATPKIVDSVFHSKMDEAFRKAFGVS